MPQAAAKQAEAKATPMPEEKRVIELQYPVEFAGELYPTLTVRRLVAGDLRELDVVEGGGQAQGIAMAALICDVPEGVIDKLDLTDYFKVQEAVADFFPKALVDKLQT